jgi:hypothetical protein
MVALLFRLERAIHSPDSQPQIAPLARCTLNANHCAGVTPYPLDRIGLMSGNRRTPFRVAVRKRLNARVSIWFSRIKVISA